LAKLGPVVRVAASDERSQHRNRELAEERLRERLAQALKIETPRRPTRPTLGSKKRRLDAKSRRSTIKQLRQAPPPE
jgi:ribosome-associated protein